MPGLWSRGTLNPVCASIGTSAVFPVATRSAFRRLFTLPAAVLFVQFVLLASGVVLLAVRPEGQRQH